MPHLAPINWLIIWLFIWFTFSMFSIVIWWSFKPFYKAPLLTTPRNLKSHDFWNW